MASFTYLWSSSTLCISVNTCFISLSFEMISEESDTETKSVKSVAITVNHLFGNEEYVKVKKSDGNKTIDVFSRAVSRKQLLENICFEEENSNPY